MAFRFRFTQKWRKSCHFRDDVLPFYDEIEKSGGACIGIGNYKNYDLWLAGMQNRYTGKNLPEGFQKACHRWEKQLLLPKVSENLMIIFISITSNSAVQSLETMTERYFFFQENFAIRKGLHNVRPLLG